MNDELSYEERREWAKTLYIIKGDSIKDIALQAQTDEATVRQWKQEGAWDGMKRSNLLSKKTQAAMYLEIIAQLTEKNKENPSLKDADLIFKYSTIVKNLEEETSVSEIIEVFEIFIKWLRQRDKQLTKKVVALCDAFVKERLAA